MTNENITVSRELLRQTLEASASAYISSSVISALRAALEQPAVEPVAVHQVKIGASRWCDITEDELQDYSLRGFWETRTLYTVPTPAEPTKVPGMAVQALAGEIVEALLADEKDGGYDLTAGLFGPAFSKLVRRWAVAEWNAPQAQQLAVEPVAIYHGRCVIDCGEHGHHDVEMLRMIPAGTELFASPPTAIQAAREYLRSMK